MSLLRVERVIAMDPGKLSGMAVLERRRTTDEHVISILESFEAGPDEFIPTFRTWYDKYNAPAAEGQPRARVVLESFHITPETGKKSQEASWALEQIGAAKQACRDFGYPVDAIMYFRPSQKQVFPNPRLKKLGLWHVGGKGHALDAIRHGVLYLAQSGTLPENA